MKGRKRKKRSKTFNPLALEGFAAEAGKKDEARRAERLRTTLGGM